ncbi:hypothetical protein VT84_00265 [Gemmata sp. SH-PL17]|nr:hypothetical protein VT84_00265 [Gemmata sp. SH-PL17]
MRYLHNCPYCEEPVTVTPAQVGKRAQCAACDGTFTVPSRVRSAPVPEKELEPIPDDDGATRRVVLILGLVFGALALGATVVVTCCVLVITGAFDKPKPDETAQADPPAERAPEPKPEPAPKPEVTPKPVPSVPPSAPSTPNNPQPPKVSAPDPVTEPPPVDREPNAGVPVFPPEPPIVPPGRPPLNQPMVPPFGRPPFGQMVPPLGQPFNPPGFPAPGAPEPAAPTGKLTFPVPVAVELKPAPLDKDAVELKLPGKVSDAVVGGGGRYWCLLLSDQKQVAVFDVNQAKVTKYIPLAGGSACLAAGMNKLLVVYPDTEVIVRYDLGTFEKEVTAKLPFRGTVKQTCLGAASAGPMLVFYGKGTDALAQAPVTFLDITTLKELDAGNNAGGRALTASFRDAMHYRASPDGRVYGAWATSHTPTGLNGLVVSETGVKAYNEHTSAGNVVPAADGHLLTDTGVYTPELKAIGKKEWGAGTRIPAQQGDWYLSFAPAKSDDFGFPDPNQPRATKASVFRTTDDRPIVSLGDIGVALGSDAWAATDFTRDKRFLFTPAGGLIAWIAPTNDALHLRKFDLQSELDKSGVDYLFVSSRPPAAEPGKPYTYKVGVKSKQGGVTVKVDAGPEGLKVAADDTVTWAVPKDWAGSDTVILTVSDKSGQEVFHTFALTRAVAPHAVAVKEPDPEPKRPEPKRPAAPGAVPEPKRPAAPARDPKPGFVRPAAAPAKITPTKAADKSEIKLPGSADMTCMGGNGRYVLFRVPKVKQVAVLDVCEGKVVKYLPLGEEGALIAAGNEHLFVLNPTANVVQRWNLKTFEKELTVANPLKGTPRQLLVGHATDGPVFVVGPNRALDGKTFKEIELGAGANGGGGMGGMAGHPQYPPSARVSADGRVFAWWTMGLSPSGLSSMVVGDEGAKSYYEHTSVGAILPGPDGTLFTAGALYTPELKALGDAKGLSGQPIPPAHGRLFLTVSGPDRFNNKTDTKVTLRMLGEARPLVELGALAGLDLPLDPWGAMAPGGRATLPVSDRAFLVPDAHALVLLNGAGDKVIVHKIEVEALLEKAGIDYLFVVSRPPAAVTGAAFSYKPEVKSKKGGVKIKLDAGPEGMKVSADGTVTWNVPANFADGSAPVILTVSDASGQETFHTFALPVRSRP